MNGKTWMCIGFVVVGFWAAFAADSPTEQVVEPVDHGKPLINPSMGWTLHYYSNIITNYGSKLEPSDTVDDFPGLSCVYLRVPWSFLEPQEGRFNWQIRGMSVHPSKSQAISVHFDGDWDARVNSTRQHLPRILFSKSYQGKFQRFFTGPTIA